MTRMWNGHAKAILGMAGAWAGRSIVLRTSRLRMRRLRMRKLRRLRRCLALGAGHGIPSEWTTLAEPRTTQRPPPVPIGWFREGGDYGTDDGSTGRKGCWLQGGGRSQSECAFPLNVYQETSSSTPVKANSNRKKASNPLTSKFVNQRALALHCHALSGLCLRSTPPGRMILASPALCPG